jgi:hypothetical protein
MAQFDKWRERFGISDKDLSNASASSGVDALRWCLMNGKIAEPEYIEWAMKNFELPSVSGDFFTAPSDQAFWKRVKGVHAWSPSFFPLADWDGILLIACLEPPQDFELAQPHQFVLASVRHLLLLWSALNPATEATGPILAPVKVSTFIDPFAVIGSVPAGALELPDGFVMNPSVSAAEMSEAVTGISVLGDLKEMSDLVPDGLTLSGSTAVTHPEELRSPVKVDPLDLPEGMLFSADELSGKHGKDNLTATSTSANIAPTPVLVDESARQAPKPPPPPPIKSAQTPTFAFAPEVDENTQSDIDGTDDEHDGLPRRAPGTSTGFTISNIESRPISSARSLDELAAIALVHVLKTFDGAMLLKLDGEALKPWKWSELMTAPKNAAFAAAELTSPSIFRVVSRTHLPYHGYVSTSTINDAFFAAFSSSGKPPPQVTLVPILWEKQCLGMVMGVGKKPLSYKSVLPPLERIADDVGQVLSHIKHSTAA